MAGDPREVRISTFREVWYELMERPLSGTQYRLDLEANLTSLLRRLEQPWYDMEDVLKHAEQVSEELPDQITPRLESASTTSLHSLSNQISDALEVDQNNHRNGDLEDTIQSNIDMASIEDALEGTDYNIQRVRSILFGEVANLTRLEEKKTLRLTDLIETIRRCREELESATFKHSYRNELVRPIQQFLANNNPDVPIERIVSELLTELSSADWEEDSKDEAIQVLERADDIEEFCDVLRGNVYSRKYCVPLPADRITKAHISIAGVDFYMEKSDEFTFFDELVELDDRTEARIERSTQHTGFFAVLELVAPTKEVGERLMEQKLENAIDALNFRKNRGVVQSPFTQSRTTYFCILPDGSWNILTSNHQKYCFPHEFGVDEESLEYLEDNFNFLDESEKEYSNFEKRFVQSYRWYGDGIQSGIPEEEFLKYIFSMESMLVPEIPGGKKERLAQRLADLLGIYQRYRDSFKNEVISLYDTRSDLVHNAEIDILDMDGEVSSARDKASRMFGVILQDYIEDCSNIQELLADLEDRPVPEAPENHNPFGNSLS